MPHDIKGYLAALIAITIIGIIFAPFRTIEAWRHRRELRRLRERFPDRSFAPWTPAEVDSLNRFQRTGHIHEFTCRFEHKEADRTLFATRWGWRCPHCDYQQGWAHKFMTDWHPVPRPTLVRDNQS